MCLLTYNRAVMCPLTCNRALCTVLIGEEDSMVNKIVPANKIVWFVRWLRHCRESLDKIV